ncbi:FKBP-type peptidyl-prolyl cis-trans isomerase [Vreelandella rituensis]|uniref:Peptidyl-prolyl cis-trans isomerase n=1 Tax=Vreelandella rituensis TaxID=2282306 RepID=A0A368U952_9GAMM|nr:FKBP-type peptidyl-prolyl cis-trans isomerase [Halomonas rituensis]RCV93485.1 FKBP-type peptidyl-prolyl cis-trans isomerase [Halomonas rituensis]
MKTLLSSTVLTGLLVASPLALAAPETEQEQLAYSLGVTLGESMQEDISDLDMDTFTQGMRDVFEGNELALSEEQMSDALMAFQQRSLEARQAEEEEAAQANLDVGETFLEENAAREEVKVTESGLQYEVVEAGDGATPGSEDTVEVHYEGMLLDGTVFDSSYDRGEPVSFQVSQVIEGWQEALQLMSVGDTWMVYIPAELGYGAQGQGPIGPNETLTFRVELLDVE